MTKLIRDCFLGHYSQAIRANASPDVMDRLPIEVLRDIFFESLTEQHLIGWDSPLSASISSPLYIFHVCRRWRDVSLSFRELWSYLCLHLQNGVGPKQRKYTVEISDIWLARTKGCPRNFHFFCELIDCDDVEVRDAAEYIIRTLVIHHRRWKYVHFVWRLTVSPDFPDVDVSDMPLLVSFAFIAEDFRRQGTESPPVRISLAGSPMLRDLFLNDVYDVDFGQGQTLESLRWGNLCFSCDEYRNARRAAKLCLDLLKTAPNMIEFWGDFEEFAVASESPLYEVRDYIVHKVEDLTLGKEAFAALIIDKLTLPALHVLEYIQDQEEAGNILLRFFQRSLPPLEALHLSDRCINERTLVPSLRLLPTLRELSLDCAKLSAWFFEELTRGVGTQSSGDIILCPELDALHLRSLFVSGNGLKKCTDALCTMLEARWKHLKTFKRVWLVDTPDVIEIPDIRRKLRRLKKCLADEVRGEIWIGGDDDRILEIGMDDWDE